MNLEEKLDSDLAKELLTILPYLDNEFVNNLPSDLLTMLTNLAADSTKDFFIQKDKDLNEQNLSEECKNWLALLYYDFVNTSDREELLKNWRNNN